MNERPIVYLRFHGTHTDVFTVTLMEDGNKLAGPRTALRGPETRQAVTLSCGLVPEKFDKAYEGGKEIGYSLLVRDRKLAHDWVASL
jgi:hypothetical protein